MSCVATFAICCLLANDGMLRADLPWPLMRIKTTKRACQPPQWDMSTGIRAVFMASRVTPPIIASNNRGLP